MAKKRISARISESTKEHIECHAEVHGVKKGYLVEQALLHHLQALHELPADMFCIRRLREMSRRCAPVSALGG